MEMEAPRRSAADRSREPSMKKPRLSVEVERPSTGAAAAASTGDRIRPYAQARPAAASSNPRFRVNEREDREETGRGGTSYQQQEELVAQYKTALAELTFNSKPIITNLTIIAGENLHAAKAISSTVCANVLEVPIEQKLPSLYLLDSIVKNIGSDYIKYFAARLPEVFCKAYKQVDPSIHSSMRHLFGTWKGIFPSSCLQLIEKELGFSPIINGSSGGTVMRSDTQAQRPLHSIHVNPKYLEARQRFQQSARGNDLSGEDVNETIAPSDDAERSFRIPSSENMRQWPELSNKNVQRPQREQLNDFIHERKGYKDVRATVCSTHPSRKPDLVMGGTTIDRVKEPVELDKSYSGAGGIVESTAYRRNGFDATHAIGSYRDSGSAPNNSQLPSVHPNNSNKMNWTTSKNWKNSEEEEYIWDDTGSRSADYEGAKGISSWSTDDQDKSTSLLSRKLSMETEQVNSRQNKFDAFQPLTKDAGMEERIPFPRDYDEHYSQHRNSQDIVMRIDKSAWPMRDTSQTTFGLDRFSSRASGQAESRTTHVSGVLSTNDNLVLPRSGFQSSTLPSSMVPSMDLIGTGGILGLQRQLALRSPSPSIPSVPSAPLQQPKPRGLSDQDYLPGHLSQVNQKSTMLAGQFNRDSSTPMTNDAFPILSENPGQQGHTSANAQPSLMHASQHSSFPFPDLKRHLSSLQQLQTDPSVQAVQKETSTPVSQGFRANQSKGFSGSKHSNSSIDVSGQSSTSNLLDAAKKTDLLPNNFSSGMWNLNVQPPLPSGPPPAQTQTSSAPLATSTAEIPPPHAAPALALPPQGVLPPLPPGPPPSSSLSGASAQNNNSASIGLNPLSSLLSSLVAKGLITSTSTQLPTVSPSQMEKESPSQNSDLDGSTSSPPSSLNELPVSEPSTPGGVSLAPFTTTKFDNLIGVQFKTEIVREFHPLVIDSLLDDLKHQCYECGLRFRLEEQLEVHLDWHNLKNSKLSSTVQVCRRWYSSIICWISGDVELACGPSLEAAPSEQSLEPMVIADERQSICALCGEPFEDFYSIEKDEWMYKGTVYLSLMDAKCVARGVNESVVQGPIVHAKCMSTSADDGGIGRQS